MSVLPEDKKVCLQACSVGCPSHLFPAIGLANLEGIREPVLGYKTTLALCAYHKAELDLGKWANVKLIGWEDFPDRQDKGNQPDQPSGGPAEVYASEPPPPYDPAYRGEERE